MKQNRLPTYDDSDNPTGCCPRFNPDGWDDQDLHFKDRLFLRAKTRSLFHIPINMGAVFKRVMQAIEKADAQESKQIIVLSRDLSPWSAEHLFSVDRPVPCEEMVRLSGDYRTKVFEGPYRDAPKWQAALQAELEAQGNRVAKTYFFYTTCPKCAKVYGNNYLVAVADLQPAPGS